MTSGGSRRALVAPGRAGSARQRRGWSTLTVIGCLGVVFGDIGTSPLYALQTAYSMEHNAVTPVRENVYGIISMVLWTITLIVTVKYVVLITRADNGGQGGILVLLAMLRDRLRQRNLLLAVTALGMAGAALFYGDAIITPAISVLSAVEGLSVVSPGLGPWVVPTAVVILAVLFAVQSFGTGRISRAFGPIMLGWFATMAVLGIPHILAHPEILLSLSPHWAVELVLRAPVPSFVLLGAVVLTVTGAEALYADLGHFGAPSVRRAWLWVAMPALALVYLGQGASVISHPEGVGSPFLTLAPEPIRLPLVVFATVATVIASQAVISGAFSVTRQAIRLGLLPRLAIRHTSRNEEGQIYLPTVNWILCGGVLLLVLVFSSSARLASAYGLAVTGTLLFESCLFLLLARRVWRVRRVLVLGYVVVIGGLELALLLANTTKFFAGGWLPLLVAALILVVMIIWRRGDAEVSQRRQASEGRLEPFLASLSTAGIRRLPGVAVFPHSRTETAPLALAHCVKRLHLLHEQVILVQLEHTNVPHVPPAERTTVTAVGPAGLGVRQVTIAVGFADSSDLPWNLALALRSRPGPAPDLDRAVYFLSVLALQVRDTAPLRGLRQRVFLTLVRNQASRTESFHLPPTRTVVLGSEMRL